MNYEQFASEHQISATARLVDENPNMEGMPEGSRHWLVTLQRPHTEATFSCHFSMGPAHEHEPTTHELLCCVASDSLSADESFEEWCDNVGYDNDSRKAEKVYNATRDQTATLLEFLGADLLEQLQGCEE